MFICNRYDEEVEKKKYIGVWEAELYVSQSKIEVVGDSESSMKFHLNVDGTGFLEVVSKSSSSNFNLTWTVNGYVCNISVEIALSSKYVATRCGNYLEIKEFSSKLDYYLCKKQGEESNVLSNEEKFIGNWSAGYYVSNNKGSYLKDAGQHMSFELNSNGTGKFSVQIDSLEKNETYDLTWSIKNSYCYIMVMLWVLL